MDVKSGKSSISKKSNVSGEKEDPPKENPHKILNPLVIQKFIYEYVLERLKSEKLSI